ncbi:OmpP1/FadL family transporter [Ferribacterium limneticum]|uniref:OmpP1/FadL family transporter n=1 Tax=Ferribacterium limneticum TaxID=76259 RepID=UPI001CFAE1D4|nr:outer membrane protein transport protein [Ferribacterium limneticum]UCV27153.1 transporter [Ferribacterium limneticum]UCV31070.1 transporter [Ferribacterium limneticum]
MHKKLTLRLIPALIAVAFSGSAFAAAFQLTGQSASGVGIANAGAAAAAEDTSTLYYNPAGMTYLSEGHNISFATTLLDRSTRFTDEGTNRLAGVYPVGGNGGDGGGLHAVPAFYYSYAVAPQWRLGLAVNPTFADETEYDKNFAGRYSGLRTKIRIVNVNPSVAYKVNDALSVAFGINFAKADVEFNQAVPSALGPTQPDGSGTLKGDATGWGYNLGAMYQITKDTRVGLSYRSKIKFDLEGDKTQTGQATRSIYADLTMPDTASLALRHQFNDKWAALADFTWTGWSKLQKLEPVYSDGSRAVAPLRYNFKDTYRVGLGATYQLNDQWMLRMGVAFDKGAVPDDASRTMTVPDQDRTWLALGAKWKITPKASLDVGYAHIFVKEARTARNVYGSTAETPVVQTVRGKFETSVDYLSLQLNYAF